MAAAFAPVLEVTVVAEAAAAEAVAPVLEVTVVAETAAAEAAVPNAPGDASTEPITNAASVAFVAALGRGGGTAALLSTDNVVDVGVAALITTGTTVGAGVGNCEAEAAFAGNSVAKALPMAAICSCIICIICICCIWSGCMPCMLCMLDAVAGGW